MIRILPHVGAAGIVAWAVYELVMIWLHVRPAEDEVERKRAER